MIQSLSEISFIDDNGIQKTIKAYNDINSLVLAISTETHDVKARFLSNLSKRVVVDVFDFLIDQYQKINVPEKEIKLYRKKLIDTINQLILKEEINCLEKTVKSKDDLIGKQPHKIPRFNLNNFDDLVELIYFLKKEASHHGILYLENYIDSIEDPLIKKALQLVADGCVEELIDYYISKYHKKQTRNEEIKYEIIGSGFKLLLSDEMPSITKDILEGIYK